MTEVLGSGADLTRGRQTRAFEEEFADYVGARHAVACSSGTAALWLAVKAMEPSEWRVPAITFAATRNAALRHQIVDVDPDTGLLSDDSPGGAELVQRTVFVDYAGVPMDGWSVEDAAHALGSHYCNGHMVGSAGLTCFSFHPAKTITTGEGGMVTTQSQGVAEYMRRLRDNGIVRSPEYPPGYYDNSGYGLNFHMGEMAAALGRSQLRRIKTILAKRRELALHYIAALPRSVRTVIRNAEEVSKNACHIFPVLIDFEALETTRERVMAELMRQGIETNVHYVPLQRGLPGAEEFYRRELTLPLHCGLTLDDVDRVCNALGEILRG